MAETTVLTRKKELVYYGDDFTGSTDVLESLSLKGKRTVLWLRIPEPSELAQFEEYSCIGLAGVSRSKDPKWMNTELPAVFRFLNSMNPKYVHYKVCSTFDSNVSKGNISAAMHIGVDIIKPAWTSILVGTPKIKRYVCFGQLFADYKGEVFSIDRHPVMSCHPATPMNESNLIQHMKALGSDNCVSLNLSMYHLENTSSILSDYIRNEKVVIFDTYDAQSLACAGALIREHSQSGTHFTVSSSGFEDAIYSKDTDIKNIAIKSKKRILALSGSCSLITSAQIDYAIEHGFSPIKLKVSRLLNPSERSSYLDEVTGYCMSLLADDISPLVYSAKGPTDESLSLIKESDCDSFDQILGQFLGDIAVQLANNKMIDRLAVAGGDTSGYCLQCLDVDALTFVAPFCPGVPLCRTYSRKNNVDGLEVALKGGQLGGDDFFVKLLNGEE
ncbi:four-carbon acid sugar kinase family protein [Vibrio salinus]|uniref:four-carbon acid sugar kinase family protein n=1 Tax=Vibrio salinus TaxID=2899784 RepID=UPI001E33472F|nr:four-carbon acid sugar kinase family protein [Vibrio salinus]MCE0494893.1 hypothetical protein [Vibrio salinus]